MQQDLALVSLLGLPHVERNGHHFVDGFAGRPGRAGRFLRRIPTSMPNAARAAAAHRDGGVLSSLACPGFAVGAGLDFSAMRAMPPAPSGRIGVTDCVGAG